MLVVASLTTTATEGSGTGQDLSASQAKPGAKSPPACALCADRKARIAKLDEVMKLLEAAKAAADTGDAKTASTQIAKTQTLLNEVRASAPACPACQAHKAAKGKVCNVRCPMMGTSLDPDKVPAELTRLHRGQKVGFCCAGCPAAWDKLSEEEKDAKLKAATNTQ